MTLAERLCDPKLFEHELDYLGREHGFSIVDSLADAIRDLHATIAERDRQIGALVEAAKSLAVACFFTNTRGPDLVACKECRAELARDDMFTNSAIHREGCQTGQDVAVLTNLPAAAKARDERLKAEGAAEALEGICKDKSSGGHAYSAKIHQEDGSYYRLGIVEASVIYAEAARLREEAGR